MLRILPDLTQPKTLNEAVAEINEIFEKPESTRLQGGKLLLALRNRIEAGEAGENVNWWRWYTISGFYRTRKDAEKVMRMARADDPQAAVVQERTETRNRMVAQRKVTAHVRSKTSKPKRKRIADPVGQVNEFTAELFDYKDRLSEWIGQFHSRMDTESRRSLWAMLQTVTENLTNLADSLNVK